MRALLTLVLLVASMSALGQSTGAAKDAAVDKPARPRSTNPADLEPAVDVGGPRITVATSQAAPAAPVASKAPPPPAPKSIIPPTPAPGAAPQAANPRV